MKRLLQLLYKYPNKKSTTDTKYKPVYQHYDTILIVNSSVSAARRVRLTSVGLRKVVAILFATSQVMASSSEVRASTEPWIMEDTCNCFDASRPCFMSTTEK